MAALVSDEVPWDSLSVGATRPPVVSLLNVPIGFVLPILAIPMLFVMLTRNPLWLLLAFVLTALVRWFVATDHNRPRVLWLAFLSGALWTDRRRWGGVSFDPLGTPHDARR